MYPHTLPNFDAIKAMQIEGKRGFDSTKVGLQMAIVSHIKSLQTLTIPENWSTGKEGD